MLCIDTSAGTSISVLRGLEVLAEINEPNTMLHAESIGLSIQQALRLAGLRGSDIQVVAVGRGPAPFTGLRVGIAAGTVFAEAVGARLLGVVSLDALALAAFGNQTFADKVSGASPLLVTADARRSEVYWALYTGLSSHGLPLRSDLPGVNKPAALDEMLTDRNVAAIRLKADAAPAIPIATALGLVANAMLAEGQDGRDVSPLYLRAPDAVLPKQHARFGKAEYSKPVLGGGSA